MKKVFLNSLLEIKGVEQTPDDPSILKIAGYANYATKDRGNEVILPEAWKKGLENYKKNPVVLFQHKHDQPIGTCSAVTVDDKGLFIEAKISSAAEKLYGIQTLIRDGALKAFSVGFIPKRGRKDTATDTLYITELELLENSVVSVPMQQDSLFSVVKSLQDAGEYEKFLAENVEEFDSTKEKATVNLEINIVTADVNNGEQTGEEECIPETPETPEDPNMEMSAVVNSTKVYDIDSNLIFTALKGKEKAKYSGKNFIIVSQDFEKHLLGMQEVSILGNPIGEILNIDINTLNILNLTKVDTSDYVVLKMVEKRSDVEISQLFADLVKADIKELKTTLTQENLPNLAKKQLSYTIDLMEKPIKDWNPDDYIVANKIVDYILSRSHLEAEDTKTLLMLHGHVEENSEMTQQIGTQVVDEEVTQVASAPVEAKAAPTASVSVAEPAVMGLVQQTGEALVAAEAARESMVPASELKKLEDKLERFMAQYKSNSDKIAAANNDKVVYTTNNSVERNKKDVTNAVLLSYLKNPGSEFSMGTFASSKLGAGILASQKATITSVDALITDFTSEVMEQMQIELKIAPMLRNMEVTAQNFKIPVADEETNGDIAQFANGTYNVGETDSTRVPTTRQNTITAVNLTPHKFMGTTHLAKDEQEDVLIPLLDFQVRSLTRRMARAIDKALLRGDGSLSGFTASPTNSIVAGTGYASVITGLCPLAYNGGSALRIGTGGTSTKATPTTIASARAALGRYGLDVGSNNLVYLTSIEGYNDLVTTSDFRTMDKFGDKATYITGQVGSIYGIPVVISEFLDVVGVSGNHVGLLVYLPGFIVGRRRALEVESYYDPRRQLTAIYLSTRFDLKALTTNASAALDTTKYNMAAVVTSN
jgi:HK97 family phage prohead protease/HK97 family phage major capsid protein